MHPVLFRIGDFYIPSYGVLIAVGIFVAITIGSYRMKKRGLPSEVMYDLGFVTIIFGFLGARILYILTNFQEFLSDPGSIIFSRSGFVFLGGLVGGIVAGIIYLKKKGYPVLHVADISAASLAIGHGVGRLACYAAGCCFGGVCQNPNLGITFPPVVIPGTENSEYGPQLFYNAYSEHLHEGLITPEAVHSLHVWPVQLMESFGLFAIAGVLIWFGRKNRFPGVTLALYLCLYSVLRFMLEFLRGDPERGFILGISTSQFISLLILPAGIGLWVYLTKNPVEEDWKPQGDDHEDETDPRAKSRKMLKTKHRKSQ